MAKQLPDRPLPPLPKLSLQASACKNLQLLVSTLQEHVLAPQEIPQSHYILLHSDGPLSLPARPTLHVALGRK